MHWLSEPRLLQAQAKPAFLKRFPALKTPGLPEIDLAQARYSMGDITRDGQTFLLDKCRPDKEKLQIPVRFWYKVSRSEWVPYNGVGLPS